MSPLKRLFSYTFRFKFSFFLSILGFILFASADIAAVEWIRRIIEFINSDQQENNESLENKETTKKSSWDSSPLVPEVDEIPF